MKFLSENDKLLCLELELRAEGFCFIAGVDEVGRGPLAGPVVAAAVVFPGYTVVPWVDDSKKLTPAEREEADIAIRSVPGVDIALAVVEPEEIDRINILRATHKAMWQAVAGLERCDYVLVDGRPVGGFGIPDRSIVKGDAKCASIAAASIVAKVYRDRLMTDLESQYPGYGFAAHKGYGTAEHLAALKKLGPVPVHRRSFAPVRDILSPPPEQLELF